LIINEVKRYISIENIKNITAGQFWKTIKHCLQGSQNIYIGTYLRNLSIPIEISAFNSKSIFNIKFTDHKLEEYIRKFCKYFNLKNYNKNIISEFNKYIKNAMVGYVGIYIYFTYEKIFDKIFNLFSFCSIHPKYDRKNFIRLENSS